MVQIIGFESRRNKEGEEFHVLVLAGGLEMVKSRTTGRFYATNKQCTVSCTMDKEQCKAVVGQQLPGSIRRVKCDPYEMIDESSGEIITREHRWEYAQESESLEETLFEDEVVIGATPALQEAVV